jgi:hypothetical protein
VKRFWSLAAAHWPLSLPRRRLDAAIGEDLVAELVGARVLQTGALVADDEVPCGTCRSLAQLVEEPEGLVAVCPAGCPCEPFGELPERVYVEPVALALDLARALGTEGVPGPPEPPVVPLGRRSIGEQIVAFDLVGRPARAGTMDMLHRMARGGPIVRVVLVPDARRLAADVPAEIPGAELLWTGLDEVLVLEGGMRVNLGPLLLRRVFPGVVWERPFEGLLLDATGARWRGQALALAPTGLRLLTALAAHPGERRSQLELWRELWPDDHTRNGRIARGVSRDLLDNRLRLSVTNLRAALRRVGLDRALENVRVAGGGYRLALNPEQVRMA